MSLLSALEKHIPSAKILLDGVSATSKREFFYEPSNADFICAMGLSVSFYASAREWLDEDPKRRLCFVEDRPEALAGLLEDDDAILLLNDLRVRIYFFETPLQIEVIAKKIGWSSVFLKLEIIDAGRPFLEFKTLLEKIHTAANLLLSDGADWGCQALKHLKKNFSRPFRSALELKDAFKGTMALIVGAGPSLEKNGHLLKKFQDRALILSGGNGLSRIGFPPEFAACVDKQEKLSVPFPHVPFCFQARACPDSISKMKGEPFLIPDGHFPFLNFISGQKDLFDGGWTVGTILASLAVLWGCDPIVFVGMDFCYSGAKKYASSDEMSLAGLIETKDASGKTVWTQRDWVMAVEWLNEFVKKHPERSFFNATEGGIGFLTRKRLEEIKVPQISGVHEKIKQAIQKVPVISPSILQFGLDKWKESLKRCEQKLNEMSLDIEEEIAWKELFSPLWTVWRPVFERVLDLDPHKISFDGKMRINEILFYKQIIEEHLSAIE